MFLRVGRGIVAVYDEEQEKNIKQNGGEIKTDSVMDSFSFCLLGSFVDFSLLDNPQLIISDKSSGKHLEATVNCYPGHALLDISLQLELLISKNYFLHKSAQEAYKGFVRAYASHKEKRLFDVEKLDLKAVAKSFGFSVPPYVDLSILFLHLVVIATFISVAGCGVL